MLLLLLALAPAVRELVGLADTVLLPLSVAEAVPEPDPVPVALPVPLLLELSPGVTGGVLLAEAEGGTERLSVPAAEPEVEPLLLPVGEGELLLQLLPEALGGPAASVPRGLPEGVALPEGEAEALSAEAGLLLALGLGL